MAYKYNLHIQPLDGIYSSHDKNGYFIRNRSVNKSRLFKITYWFKSQFLDYIWRWQRKLRLLRNRIKG